MARRYQPQYTVPGSPTRIVRSSQTDWEPTPASQVPGRVSAELTRLNNEIEYLHGVNDASNPLLDNRMRVLQSRLKRLEGRREDFEESWGDARESQRKRQRRAQYDLMVAKERREAIDMLGREATPDDRREAKRMMKRARRKVKNSRGSVRPEGLTRVNNSIRNTKQRINNINKRQNSTTQNNVNRLQTPPTPMGHSFTQNPGMNVTQQPRTSRPPQRRNRGKK